MSSIHDDARARAHPHGIAIAVETTAGDPAQRAHIIPPSMVDLGRHGVTAWGFPVDQLLIMPDLEWAEIDPTERCEHCADSAS